MVLADLERKLVTHNVAPDLFCPRPGPVRLLHISVTVDCSNHVLWKCKFGPQQGFKHSVDWNDRFRLEGERHLLSRGLRPSSTPVPEDIVFLWLLFVLKVMLGFACAFLACAIIASNLKC